MAGPRLAADPGWRQSSFCGVLLLARHRPRSPREGVARGKPHMGSNRRQRRVEPTEDWEQIELLCAWPEQRDYELIRPSVLFGSQASERAKETGAASERTLQRRVVRFGAEGM